MRKENGTIYREAESMCGEIRVLHILRSKVASGAQSDEVRLLCMLVPAGSGGVAGFRLLEQERQRNQAADDHRGPPECVDVGE